MSTGDIAQTCHGRGTEVRPELGLAIRLGQRLSGGVAAPLKQSGVSVSGDRLVLTIKGDVELLLGDAVERRWRQLGNAIGKAPEIGRT